MKEVLFSILGFGPRELLIVLSQNIKEIFELLKYNMMIKLCQNKKPV